MAQECPREWAETRDGSREWHLGHVHHRTASSFGAVDEIDGVVVRTLPSLAGRDAWHYQHGYIGGRRAVESYLWDYERGLVGMLHAPIPDDRYRDRRVAS
jgi:hypothetical protein